MIRYKDRRKKRSKGAVCCGVINIMQCLGVKNLWDGNVEMEVQGDRGSIARLLERLGESSFICIESMESMKIPVVKESGFREI